MLSKQRLSSKPAGRSRNPSGRCANKTTGAIMRQRKSLITPKQCRAARALLEASQVVLAEMAVVGVSTVPTSN